MERGADVNATNRHTKSGDAGLTVLEIAKQNGNTPIVEFLAKAKLEPRPEMVFVEDMLGGFTNAERALTYVKALLTPTGLLCRMTVPKGDPFKDLATINCFPAQVAPA